ncbi:hypothetical protein NR800_26675 [Corallococcus interemptor]|uniref:hypothetical protein n=1 Tax=Corallococcus TaxID=83461 RepID=UPI001CBD3A62|nr:MULTISPECIES: hypothetical protein [unclassified Corallococcus]
MARKAQGQQDSGTQAGARPARRKTSTRKTASAPSEGRLELRRDIAEYRAAAEAQADIVRERINAALEVSRRTREEIEQRIASELHTPRVTAKKAAAPARKRTRAASRASTK